MGADGRREVNAGRGHRWASGRRSGVGGVEVSRARAREWADGWRDTATCPRDPKQDSTPGARGYWREPIKPWSDAAKEAHDRRRQIVRKLRQAGYLARRWPIAPVEDLTGKTPQTVVRYTDGPAAWERAVDPWVLARDLQRCEAGWGVALAAGPRGPRCVPMALRCNRLHLCPRCAGRRSAAMAEALGARISAEVAQGRAAVLVTFTQRADPRESIREASDRLRAAFRKLRKTQAWKRNVFGAFLGWEVTHREGRGWHAHCHAVLIVPDCGHVRADIGRAWRDVSDRVRPGWGWSPVAGGCRVMAARELDYSGHTVSQLRKLAKGTAKGLHLLPRAELLELVRARASRPRIRSWAGGWWRPLETPEACYQACKYPTPAVDLAPAALVEFVSFAHGRRFHEGSGCLRGLLAEVGADEAQEGAEESETIISMGGPHLPPLDAIAPDLGVPAGVPTVSVVAPVRWRLVPGMVRIALDAGLIVGVETESGVVVGLREWGADLPEGMEDPHLCGAMWFVARFADPADPGRQLARSRGEPRPPAWSKPPIPVG